MEISHYRKWNSKAHFTGTSWNTQRRRIRLQKRRYQPLQEQLSLLSSKIDFMFRVAHDMSVNSVWQDCDMIRPYIYTSVAQCNKMSWKIATKMCTGLIITTVHNSLSSVLFKYLLSTRYDIGKYRPHRVSHTRCLSERVYNIQEMYHWERAFLKGVSTIRIWRYCTSWCKDTVLNGLGTLMVQKVERRSFWSRFETSEAR